MNFRSTIMEPNFDLVKKWLQEERFMFWNQLKDWNLNDIDNCLALNINYGAAKLMLSFIDILGAFYGGLIKEGKDYYVRISGDGRSRREETKEINGVNYIKSTNKEQFLNFVKNYIHEFYKIKIKNKSAAEYLYDHFRCGLIHEGHPKMGTGIIRINNKEVLKFNYQKIPVVLNIQYLRDCLRRAVMEYEYDAFEKNIKERVYRWRDRFEYLSELKI